MKGISSDQVVLDEVSFMRQKKCGQRPQGHSLTQVTHGLCSNCLIKIDPPSQEKGHPSNERKGNSS